MGRTMKIFTLTRIAFGCVMTLVGGNVVAQSDEEADLASIYGDQRSVSIATGSAQLLRRAPAVATVITAEDISAMGAKELGEILETVPGLHVSRNSIGNNPLYVFRGIYSANNNQTLVLQNGIPMTLAYLSSKGGLFVSYPVENIARIEIIRGPGSALYGADAFAGVINIITKMAADVKGTLVGARVGSFNDRSAWVQHGGKLGAIDVAGYLNIGKTDGFKRLVEADAQTLNDKGANTNASLAPGLTNTAYNSIDANLDLAYDKWRFRAGYKLRDNIGSGFGLASALDPVGKGKTVRINADLSWVDRQFGKDLELGFLGAYTKFQDLTPQPYVLFPPGVKLGQNVFADGTIGAPNKWERHYKFSFYAAYSGFDRHHVRIGVGHDILNLYKTTEAKNFVSAPSGLPIPTGQLAYVPDSLIFVTPHNRKNSYIYLQDEWKVLSDWTLTAGIRRDRFSDFGGTTNPRLALVWDASADITAKFLYGQAYRAPSFQEQYAKNNPVILGNPNVRPETIKTLETAIAWQANKDTQINVNIFRYSAKDIIRPVANQIAGTGATFANIGALTGQGLEFEAIVDATRDLRFLGNYAYQVSKDETTRQDAGYAPHHHLALRTDWRVVSGWLFTSQFDWVVDRKRPAGDARPNIADYKTLDFFLRSTVVKNWEFSGGIRNIFNADVREPSLAPGRALPNDLPQAPRAVFLQAVYKL
jgi:outer membrane receptor protein involved in Fe transport